MEKQTTAVDARLAAQNIAPPEKFNPPTEHLALEMKGASSACSGYCYVYDPRSWRHHFGRRNSG